MFIMSNVSISYLDLYKRSAGIAEFIPISRRYLCIWANVMANVVANAVSSRIDELANQ